MPSFNDELIGLYFLLRVVFCHLYSYSSTSQHVAFNYDMIMDSLSKGKNNVDNLQLSSGPLRRFKSKSVQRMHDLQYLARRCLENHSEDSCKEYHI